MGSSTTTTSILSDAYRNHPLHLHHISPLDYPSLQSLPDSHAWPPTFDYRVDQLSLSIPLIDLKDPDTHEVIGNACETWGAFQLKNHGICMKLIEEMEFETKRLFDLPARQKLKALRSPSGATGYGLARISPFFSKFMWHEGFTIMGSPLHHATQLWPSDYQRFCDVTEEYQREMKELAEKITRLIFKFLNIDYNHDHHQETSANWLIKDSNNRIRSESSGAPCTALQLNSYPSCPDPHRAMGLAPHTDTFLLTILHQSQIHGLQVLKEEVGWVPVCPIPGALVVNVGDLLHILSNGRFPSVLHRVIVNGSWQRLSMAYFYGPPIDFCISPQSSDITTSPCYRSLTVNEYVSIKAKNLDKALDLIRI